MIQSPALAKYVHALVQSISRMAYTLQDGVLTPPSIGEPVDSDYITSATKIMRTFLEGHSSSIDIDDKTTVRLLPQFPKFGLFEYSRAMTQLLRRPGAKISFVSGYFNPTDELIQSGMINKAIAAHSSANAFYPGIVSRFYRAYIERAVSFGLQVQEWQRIGWTFHAKGLWVFDKDDNMLECHIGSSNIGYRSDLRDFELQAVVVTKDDRLKQSLVAEFAEMWQQSSPIGASRETLWIRILARLGKTFF